MVRRCSVFLAFLSLTVTATAADWDRFRGPNGTGISNDRDVPVKWTEKDIAWKQEIPGVGNSSPIVSKGRVFVHSSAKDGSARSLHSYEAATGKPVWTKTIPAVKAHTHNLNSLASSTPAADGERVYVAFWDGKEVALHAYDFDGNHLWKHVLGSFRSQHGAGASPVVYDGKVIILHDQDKILAENPERASILVCLDAVKGKVVWEKVRPAHRACYSSPFIVEKGGKKELVLSTTPGVVAYDLASGKELWKYDWKGNVLRTVASPVQALDLILVASGDGKGDRHFIAIQLDEKGAETTARVAWQDRKNRNMPYVPCALAHGEHTFCVNDEGYISCLATRTGKEVWKERLGNRKATASPVLIDGKIHAIDETGKVYVVEAGPTFKLLSVNDAGESVSASPAVADGRLFIRGRTNLICVGKK